MYNVQCYMCVLTFSFKHFGIKHVFILIQSAFSRLIALGLVKCKSCIRACYICTYLDLEERFLLGLEDERRLDRERFERLRDLDFLECFLDLDRLERLRDLDDLDGERVLRRLTDFSFARMPITGSMAALIIFCASFTIDIASSISR